MAGGALRVPGPARGAAEVNPDRIGPGQLVDGAQVACWLDNPSQSPPSSLLCSETSGSFPDLPEPVLPSTQVNAPALLGMVASSVVRPGVLCTP